MTLMGRRRLRFGVLALAAIIFFFVFISSHEDYRLPVPSFRQLSKDEQFVQQVTEQVEEDSQISTEQQAMKNSLAEAEQAAKVKTEQKDRERQAQKVENANSGAAKEDEASEAPKEPPSGEIIEFELKDLLSKSPIVIFSKTYCPYSQRAKKVFAEYEIEPRPFIVELDKHPYGAELQAMLGQKTQRTTVPNVLVKGVSIGGGDDVEHLHEQRKLAPMVLKMAGDQLKMTIGE